MEFPLALTLDGGIRTPKPYPIIVSGRAITSGWWVDLTAADVSEACYTNGEVFHEACNPLWVCPQVKGLGIRGDLSSFSLPRELLPGDRFRHTLDYQIGDAHHVGEATPEILAVPNQAGFGSRSLWSRLGDEMGGGG